MKYLGEHFDIHCGGADHPPVHHTNEIAQSEAATGAKWVNYWLHGEWLLMEKEKMAKSSGNFTTLTTLTDKGYDPLDYRYFCLGAHYRTQLAFGWESLDAARAGRLGVVEKIQQLLAQAEGGPVEPTGKAAEYLADFETHAADDLNMPRCLADLWTLLRDSSVPAAEKLGAAFRMDRIFGLGLSETKEEEIALDDETRASRGAAGRGAPAAGFQESRRAAGAPSGEGHRGPGRPQGPEATVCRWPKKINGCNIWW